MLTLDLEGPQSGGDAGYRLQVGAVIRKTFGVTLAGLVPFTIVGLIVYSPSLLVLALAALLPVEPATAQLLVAGSNLLERILSLILSGALTYGVIERLRGHGPGVGETVRTGLRSALRVLFVSMLSGVITLVGLLLCVAPGLMIYCALWVAVPVAVMEGTGVQESMDRSQHLTSGTRWPVFAVNLIMLLCVFAGGILIFAVAGVAYVLAGRGQQPTVAMEALLQLVSSVILIPFECLYSAAIAVGYHDLRVHREGAGVDDLVRVFE